MKPLLFPTKLLSITTLIFVLISDENLVGATNNKLYESCQASNRKHCGDNQTISFPFFIDGVQDRSCGFPNFQISCDDNRNPVVKLSGDDYVIKRIFYHNQSLIVSNSAFRTSSSLVSRQNTNATTTTLCFGSPVKDLSLREDDRFSLAPNQTRVSLLYNRCLRDGCYELDHRRNINSSESCGDYLAVEAPVLDRRRSHVGDALRGGFMLTWKASNCSYCESTKGKCGFNFESYHFQCFCPDRPHAARCGPPNGVRTLKVKLVAGFGIPLVGLICFMIGFFVWRHYIRRRNKNMLTRNISDTSMNADTETDCVYYGIPLFSYKDLQQATNNFDAQKELGDGGFGTVYHGVLKDGREVAVKRLYEHNYRRVEQFMNEVEILTTLRHRNLVTLYGCTSHRSRDLLLVYEYIPNGTLADHLHGDGRTSSPLDTSWPMRLSVAVETAAALAYLHASGTVHRDVKSANILLDSAFAVKVADFGLSRLFPSDVTHVSTAPQGTPGYVDPEYHQCYQLTAKSDVYSFGVVLAELLSSMPAVDIARHRHEINLSSLARAKISSRAFEDLVDPRLGIVTAAAVAFADLAFRCLEQDKEMRPTMDEVLAELKRIENGDDPATETVDTDEACLLKTEKEQKEEEEEPGSPNTVTLNWPSNYSTTPNISTDKVTLSKIV